MPSQKIIVVGKNSVIGKCYCRHAEDKGYPLEALSYENCDFLDGVAVKKFFQRQKSAPYSVIFYAAVNKRVRNDNQAFMQNVQMVQNLIQAVRGTNVSSVIFFSSSDVYGLAPQLPITEQTKINPESYYSLAKAACEWMLFSELECPVTALRIPGAYAMPGDVHGAIGKLIRKTISGEKITLSNHGEALRDYVLVDDINKVIDLLLEKPYAGALNLATGKSVSLKDILKIIEEKLEIKPNIAYSQEVTERDFNLVFDVSLFKSLFPYFRFTDLKEGIKNYILQEKEAVPS